MRILGIIPARGGSKGIPRKNLADLCGRPLIAWSIQTGNELVSMGALARCIVSTDDEEIAGVARNLGADVPFMRPSNAATDTSKSAEYVFHALEALKGLDDPYDAFMLLQPTSPCRNSLNIAKATKSFCDANADSLISCYQEDYVNDLVMYSEVGSGFLRPLNPNHNKGVRRQDHGPSYVRNGALYITKVSYFYKTKSLISDQPLLMRMSKLDSIDVDTPEDLVLLRAVLCK